VGDATPPGSLPDAASLSEVEATLHEYAGLTRRELGRYLPAKEPSRYLYDLVSSSAGAGGKGLRPAICIAACKAFGGTAERALHAAVSFELLHAAFLVHDDVEDGSLVRRGRPTLHERYNAALAVNAGDGLALLSLEPLFDGLGSGRRRRALEILAEFQQLARETIEGQAIELGWIADNVMDATVVDYLTMTMKKTTWYTVIGPCRVGAMLGARRPPAADRFLRFGFFLGAMFQIQDDLRNLLPGPRADEEVPMSDIREGKRTLMLIHLLRKPKPSAEADELRRILDPDHVPDDGDVRRVFEMMEAYGSITVGKACVRGLAAAAVGEFDAAFGDLPPSADKRFLAGLTPYLFATG
jgi:geranylgeranyl diphosphate synthase type II